MSGFRSLPSLRNLFSNTAFKTFEAVYSCADAAAVALFRREGALGILQLQQVRWASKKQGGSTQNNKDSNPKYLGVKIYGGQRCAPGHIIIRQRGTEFHPGVNVGIGKDHTIYSLVDGHVRFSHDRIGRRRRRVINVDPALDRSSPSS